MILQAIYDGKSITTQHKDSWRHSAITCADSTWGWTSTTAKASSLEELAKDKFIARYAAFLHTTMSHTPEHPRSRVIFLLDTPIMQPQNYALAATALVWLYGGLADRKCKDPARFFYGSLKCDCEYFNNVLPLEVVKKLIANYRESGMIERKQATRSNYTAPATQAEVYEALRHIPPWQIDYDEWVAILMSIHAEFGDAGLNLAEAWADGHPGEVERKWQSFHVDGNPQGSVSIASLFHIAKNFGWNAKVTAS